jgi:palmitoyltransferase
VAYLLAKGQDVDTRDSNGMTALMWAAYRVFGPDPARLLLTFDARVNLKDSVHGNSALHWAASSGNHAVVKLLMDHGADLDMSNTSGLTALDIATKRRAVWITQKLKEYYKSRGQGSNGIVDRLASSKVRIRAFN